MAIPMAKMISKTARFGIDMYAAGEAAKAKQREDMRNAAIAQQARKTATNRDTQAFLKNQQDLKDQNTADNFNISIAQVQAQDELAMSTAGSGLSGASVDELGDQITREVGRDRVAVHRSMTAASDAARINLKQENENRVYEAQNAYVHNYSKDLEGDFLSSVSSVMSI